MFDIVLGLSLLTITANPFTWVNNGNNTWSVVDSNNKKIVSEWYGDYHLDEDGVMEVSKWIRNPSGTWSYVGNDGKYLRSTWLKDKEVWYYFDKDGIMQTDWVQIDNVWYHFAKEGQMNTNTWIENKGDWYYVSENGKLATNTNIGDYFVNENGLWVDTIKSNVQVFNRLERPETIKILKLDIEQNNHQELLNEMRDDINEKLAEYVSKYRTENYKMDFNEDLEDIVVNQEDDVSNVMKSTGSTGSILEKTSKDIAKEIFKVIKKTSSLKKVLDNKEANVYCISYKIKEEGVLQITFISAKEK